MRNIGGYMRWLNSVVEVFLPRVCVVCGRRLNINESCICLHCLADLPLTHFWSRTHNPMADRFNVLINSNGGSAGERYIHACPLFFFRTDSPYRNILYEIKYKGNLPTGEYMGRMLGERIKSSEIFKDIDVVIPVPLHWRRRWKRGYNQAEIIASGVASILEVPLRNDLLKRIRNTKTQTRMEIAEKAANVHDAFKAFPSGELKHILIIDDVFTTGSTLMACFTALRTVFPPSVRISVATLAFVGRA